MPHSPHLARVSSCEQATQSGGCGFCIGFGTTMRRGKLKYLPLCSLGPSLNIGMMARTASSKTSRLFSMVMSNGSSSVIEALSPMPNSARPLDSRSRQATRSAMWAGWLVVSCRMPWPSLICLVRWLAAARNEAGEGEWEYSSRKWCSTSQA